MTTVAAVRREPWLLAVGVLILMHIGITVLYVAGLAVSRVPFTDSHVQSVVTSPVPPASHAFAAVTLAVGVRWFKWRDVGAVFSACTWVGYATVLVLSAALRNPPLAQVGGVLAIGFAVLAVGVGLFWNEPEGESED